MVKVKNKEGSGFNQDQINEVTPCCNNGSNLLYVVIIALIVIGVLGVGSIKISDQIADKIGQKIMDIEYSKVGGKENYEIVNKLQLEQIKDFIQQYKTQQGGSNDTANEKKSLSKDEIVAIKKTAYIEGNPDAQITIIEYSDLECPYCIRQFKDGVIKKLHEKYGDKINSAFKNFRGVAHQNSEAEASASLCAGELGGTEKYVSYYNKIFERTTGNGTGFSKDSLVPLAKEIGLNEAKFKECLDSNKNVALFDAETKEGQDLGVTGTPGSVIINNTTGEFVLIAGAYPISNFEEAIDKMIK